MKIEFASSIILAALCVSHAALRGSSNVESESRRNRRLPHMVTCDGLKAKEQVPCDQYNPDQPNDEYSPTRPMDNQTKTSEAGVNLTPGTSVGNPGSIPTRPKDESAPEVVKDLVDWGAGPRAGQFLIQGGKALAAMEGRFSVAIEDVQKIAVPVLRHRIATNFQAQAEGLTNDDVINRLVAEIPTPEIPKFEQKA